MSRNTIEKKVEVYSRDTCRLCECKKLELVMPLKPIPSADDFVPIDSGIEPQKCYPLDVYLCRNCGLVQLLDIFNPEYIYPKYLYETTTSLGLVEHFQAYAKDVLGRIKPKKGSLVVELGSNDGTLLNFFQKEGMNVLGIDPARAIAQKANKTGVETWPEFFTIDLSERIKKEKGSAEVVIANNVFANIDDVDHLVKAIRNVLSPTGVYIFETGYIIDSVRNLVFDNIYHEHVSYFSVKPLVQFFKKHGMELIQVDQVDTKGGSIRGTVQLAGGRRPIELSVAALVKSEIDQGFYGPDVYKKLIQRINEEKKQVLDLFKEAKKNGKKIAGYGACQGVTALMYYYEVAPYFDFIVDDNPRKHNTLTPGNHLPVYDSNVIYEKKPDYVLIMPWRYAEPIIKRHQKYLEQIGQFVMPLPKFEIIRKGKLLR